MSEEINNSKSQLKQDLWVLDTLNHKKNGFFIEIGAYDGITYSNTYLLENNYNWSGICIEPNPFVYPHLKNNRNCICLKELLFSEENIVQKFQCANEVSCVENENNALEMDDEFMELMKKNNVRDDIIEMKTNTLLNVVRNNNVPKIIDYISCDTEGTELEIIKNFPFNEYLVKTITIEHNAGCIGDKYQKQIREFLESKDFEFIKGNDPVEGWNQGPIDDFYKNKNF